MIPPTDLMTQLRLRDPVHVTQTKIADIWKVTDTSGAAKALKIYKDRDPRDEAPGFALMQAAAGAGCLKVDRFADGVAVLEWLDGPTAGDLTRGGDDAAALDALIGAMQSLHAALPAPIDALRPVSADIDVLAHATFAPDCPDAIRTLFMRCKTLGRQLMETQGPPRPLHGDVHHDNVIVTARGPLLLDAKGQMGEAAYETANIFRNPLGAGDMLTNPDRTRWMAARLGAAFDCPPSRLLHMAAVRSALSAIWQYGPVIPTAPDAIAILEMQLALIDEDAA